MIIYKCKGVQTNDPLGQTTLEPKQSQKVIHTSFAEGQWIDR